MEVRDLELNDGIVADFLGTPAAGAQQKPKNDMNVRFGMEPLKELNPDLLGSQNQEGQAVTESSLNNDAVSEELKLQTPVNADMLADPKKTAAPAPAEGGGTQGEPAKPAELKPEELKTITDYFTQRVADGKFVAVNDVDEQGNKTPFVPKSFEDLDEVIQIQVDYKLDEAKKNLEKQWYDSKSPAWKAISQYAEMVDDPTQLIPFLQGVRTIQTVEQIDENEIDGAEEIVRIRLEQSSTPSEAIEAQVEALKTSDKLISTAKQFKPLMVNQEKQMLAQQVRERQIYEQRVAQEMDDIRNKAYTELEKPIFGKQQLKREEKALVYNMLAQYDQETDGFVLYKEIDKLYASRDFETLKQVALLLAKKDAFFQYAGVDASNKTAQGIQRKLQAAVDGRTNSGNDYDEDKGPVVTRNRSTGQVRFGK